MPLSLDEALEFLEEFVEYPSEEMDPSEAMDVAIASGQPEALELVSEAIGMLPDVKHLKPLWDLAESEDAEEDAQVEALGAIGVLLGCAGELLENEDSEFELLLTQEQLDSEYARVFAIYNSDDADEDIKRVALETVATPGCVDEVRTAGRSAAESDDELWQMTGLYVLRKSKTESGMDLAEKHLENPSNDVKVEAMRCVAELGGEDGLKRVEKMVFDGTGQTPLLAVWALSEVELPRAGEILTEASHWFEGSARGQAREALEQWQLAFPPEPREDPEDAPSVDEDRRRRILASDFEDDDDGGGGGGAGGDD